MTEDTMTASNLDRSVAEDAGPGDPVGDPVVATDDARDVLTYTLTDAAGPANTFHHRQWHGPNQGGRPGVDSGLRNDDQVYTGTVTATDPPGLLTKSR